MKGRGNKTCNEDRPNGESGEERETDWYGSEKDGVKKWGKIQREGIYTSIRLKNCDLPLHRRKKRGGKATGVGDPRTFRSAGGKSKHVGESVLVYCARRPSPPVTYKFNGGREGRKIKRTNLSQSYRLTWISFYYSDWIEILLLILLCESSFVISIF